MGKILTFFCYNKNMNLLIRQLYLKHEKYPGITFFATVIWFSWTLNQNLLWIINFIFLNFTPKSIVSEFVKRSIKHWVPLVAPCQLHDGVECQVRTKFQLQVPHHMKVKLCFTLIFSQLNNTLLCFQVVEVSVNLGAGLTVD